MGNIPSYLRQSRAFQVHFTQCIRIGRQNRKRKTLYSQQLIDIDSDSDFDDEKIIYEMTEKRKYHTHP